MVNKHVLIPILFLKDLPQEYILSYFYRPFRALSFFKNFVEMSLKAAYSTIAGGKVKVIVFRLLKNESRHFFPRFLSSPPRQFFF